MTGQIGYPARWLGLAVKMAARYSRLRSIAWLCVAGVLSSACSTGGAQFDSSPPDQRATMRLKLGLGYLRLGQLAFAQEELEKAIAADSRSDAAFHGLGLIAIEQADFATAQKHLQRAVRLNPRNDAAVSDFAAVLCHQGDSGAGIRVLEENGTVAGPEAEHHLARLNAWGACLRAAGDLRGAEKVYRRMLEQNTDLEQALIAMAELSFLNNAPLSARAFVERYFGAGHASARALLLGAEVEQMLDNSAISDAYLQRLWQRYPDSPQAKTARERFQ